MSARDKFKGIRADFWDCQDAERLTHLDPISALEAIVDCHREIESSTEATIREMGEISVDAYRRAELTEQHVDDAIDRALEAAREALEEESELGDDESSAHPMFSIDVLFQQRPAFEAAVRAMAAKAKVWKCELAISIALTPDETIEILRGERPEWFGGAPAAEASAP